MRTINENFGGYRFPFYPFRHSEVDVCARELVDVKPYVLGPRVLDEVFICELPSASTSNDGIEAKSRKHL